MRAEIINIGDEILIGQINNTNAQWLAKELYQLGFDTVKIKVIKDHPKAIKEALQSVQGDFIIVTGGLGPTLDDLTKKALAEYFQDELVFHPEIEEHIKEMFAKMDYPYTLNNKGQSFLPSKAQILWNKYGTAPGMWIENSGKTFVFLPGVPFEMKSIFQEEVIPKIKKKFKLPVKYHKTVTVFGIGESLLADRLREWEQNLPADIKLAYLPHPGRIRLRLSIQGDKLTELKEKIEKQVKKLYQYLPDLKISEEVEDLVLELHKKLTESNLKISFAESCTGGRLMSDLAAISGASKFLMGGIVAYNTSIKIDVLGVDKKIIEKYSVVHEETAKAMAKNIKKIMKTDIGVATTGNAGPTKGDSDAEIGTCIIAIATENNLWVKRFLFGQPREKVINRAVSKAYEEILKIIE